jgi:hypothetical protein
MEGALNLLSVQVLENKYEAVTIHIPKNDFG